MNAQDIINEVDGLSVQERADRDLSKILKVNNLKGGIKKR